MWNVGTPVPSPFGQANRPDKRDLRQGMLLAGWNRMLKKQMPVCNGWDIPPCARLRKEADVQRVFDHVKFD